MLCEFMGYECQADFELMSVSDLSSLVLISMVDMSFSRFSYVAADVFIYLFCFCFLNYRFPKYLGSFIDEW